MMVLNCSAGLDFFSHPSYFPHTSLIPRSSERASHPPWRFAGVRLPASSNHSSEGANRGAPGAETAVQSREREVAGAEAFVKSSEREVPGAETLVKSSEREVPGYSKLVDDDDPGGPAPPREG